MNLGHDKFPNNFLKLYYFATYLQVLCENAKHQKHSSLLNNICKVQCACIVVIEDYKITLALR